MLWAPNNAYRDWAIRDELERETGLPAVVDNDANVAGFAEARLGKTPVPADAVPDRRHRHRRRARARRGDLPGPDGDGRRARPHDRRPARARGAGAGSTAAWRRCRRARRSRGWAARRPPRTRTALIARIGRADGVVTGHTVTAAAQQGDPVAQDLFARLGRWLGIGIASLATIFELDAVVVGGGVIRTGDLLLDPGRAAAREYAYAPEARAVPPVYPATFGSDGRHDRGRAARAGARRPQAPSRSLGWVDVPGPRAGPAPRRRHDRRRLGAGRAAAPPSPCWAAPPRTFEVAGHHYALVSVTGLEPDTTYPYDVTVDGEVVWPPPRLPAPAEHAAHPRPRVGPTAPDRLRVVPLRQGRPPQDRGAAGHRRARRLRRADRPAAPRGVARRAAAARRPGLRGRADPAEPPPHRRAPRPAPGVAGRRDRRLRRVRRASTATRGATRRCAGCSRACPPG